MNLYDGYWVLASIDPAIRREPAPSAIAQYVSELVPGLIAVWGALFNRPTESSAALSRSPQKAIVAKRPRWQATISLPRSSPRFNRLVSLNRPKFRISAGVLFGYEVASFTERPCFSPTGQHSHRSAKKSIGFFRSPDKINKWLSLRLPISAAAN